MKPDEKISAEVSGRIANIQEDEFLKWHFLVEEIQARSRSPIEARMGAYLVTDRTLAAYGAPSLTDLPEGLVTESKIMVGGNNTMIIPQQRIGIYTVDFAIVFPMMERRVVVECDGHDFHEKTKEQASKDKARDRALLAYGWPVMRFSGSDIWNRGAECAAEVAEYLNFFDVAQHELENGRYAG